MDAEQVTVRLTAFVASVANLNPAVAEIGAGRLATLHTAAQELAPHMRHLADVVADGLLLHEIVALMLSKNSNRYDTAADVLQAFLDHTDPQDVPAYIAHLRATIQHVNKDIPS